MTYEARGRFEETFANVPGVTVSELLGEEKAG
jgi:hypothetical protein